MIQRYNLRPIQPGVVYSPGGEGWRFYPEERLLVGLTGPGERPTHVRTTLRFALPILAPGAILIRAVLCLRLLHHEPPETAKVICVREPPAGVWTVQAELAQPVLAECRLAGKQWGKFRLDLTVPAAGWLAGSPNRGLLLDFGGQAPGLATFAGGRPERPGPILRLLVLRPLFGRVETPIIRTQEVAGDD